MLRWFYVLAHLLVKAGAARWDARIRFLKAQIEILRRMFGGNRVIPSLNGRARRLAIGQELNHDVADVIGIVTPQTYVAGSRSSVQTGSRSGSAGRRSPGTCASSFCAWQRRMAIAPATATRSLLGAGTLQWP